MALQEAINRFIDEHNKRPKPFVWSADPDRIVEKVRRAYHALASLGGDPGATEPIVRRPGPGR